jgi:hypothetical protein
MIVYEKLETGICTFCSRYDDDLYRDGGTNLIACGRCIRRLFLTNVRRLMGDDLTGRRELRFKHGTNYVIVTAAPDGTGTITVTDDFNEPPQDPAVTKEAVKDAVKMLSIARHIAWKEFVRLGGSAEELRDDP